MRIGLLFLAALICCAQAQGLFSFLSSSFTFRERFSYAGYEPSPDENELKYFTKWTCSEFSPQTPQTYVRTSPSSVNTYTSRFSEEFIPFQRIGERPNEDGIYRDPNGFDPRGDPFDTSDISSWVGGKNRPGFSYSPVSYISNRGIASIFGRAFGYEIRRSSYSTFSTYDVEIPLCSAIMPTIISPASRMTISSILIFISPIIIFFI